MENVAHRYNQANGIVAIDFLLLPPLFGCPENIAVANDRHFGAAL